MTTEMAPSQSSQHEPRYRPGRARVQRARSAYARTIGVLDIDGLHVQGRELAPCPAPESLGDAWGMAAWFDLAALWITPRLARALHLPDDIDGIDGPIDAGVNHNWAFLHGRTARNVPEGLVADPAGGAGPGWGRVAPWSNVYDPGNPRATRVSVVLPHLDKRTSFHAASDGPELLRALHTVRRLWNTDYYWSTNTTASTLVREHTRSLTPCKAIVNGEVPPALSYRRPLPGGWSRPLANGEDTYPLIVEYDTNAAHLSPIGSADLGQGEPTHIGPGRPLAYGPRPFPGFYRLAEAPQWPAWCRPYLPRLEWLDPDEMWAPAPLVALLTKDLGVELHIVEAYFWERTGRPYDGFARTCRAAREALLPVRRSDKAADLAYRANAALYKSLWGYLMRKSYTAPAEGDDLRTRDLLWRPDHAHTIDTLSHCNMIRRVVNIGRQSARWPVAMQVDAAYYAVTDPWADAPNGMAIGSRGGEFAAERKAFTVQLREHAGEPTFMRMFRKHAVDLAA